MAYMNGLPASTDDLKTLALTNYGHFTSMRVDDGRVRGLSLHMARLSRDSREVFDTELDTEYVLYLAHKAAAQLTGSYVMRITVFDPTLEMGHPGIKADPKILITSRPAAALPLQPLRIQSFHYVRGIPQVKHVSIMGALTCRRKAQINGYDDAVFMNSEGLVTEGATWNIGFIDGDRVIWPKGDILPGVTTALLADVYSPAFTAHVNIAEVHGMDAAFATNTSIGVRPIIAIDGHEFTDRHPLLKLLGEKYQEIRGEDL